MPLRVSAESERRIVLASRRVPRPSQLEIAREFDLSQACVGGIWRRNGICFGKGARREGFGRGKVTSPQIKERILALAKNYQLSQTDIARRMAIPRSTVAQVMRRSGEARKSGAKTPYQKYKNSQCPVIRLLGGGMERSNLSLESLAGKVGYGKSGNLRQASKFLLEWFAKPNKKLPPYEKLIEMAKILEIPAPQMDEAYRDRVQRLPRSRDKYCLSVGGCTYFLPDIYDSLLKSSDGSELPLMPLYKCPKCERELPLVGWFYNLVRRDSIIGSFPRCRWCTNMIRAKRKHPNGETKYTLHTLDKLLRSGGGIAWQRLRNAGYPDLTILLPSGKTILAEVKGPRDQGPRGLQLDCAVGLRQRGVPVVFLFVESFTNVDVAALISNLEESGAGFPGKTRLTVGKNDACWQGWE